MLTIHVLPRRLKEFLLTHPLYKSPLEFTDRPQSKTFCGSLRRSEQHSPRRYSHHPRSAAPAIPPPPVPIRHTIQIATFRTAAFLVFNAAFSHSTPRRGFIPDECYTKIHAHPIGTEPHMPKRLDRRLGFAFLHLWDGVLEEVF